MTFDDYILLFPNANVISCRISNRMTESRKKFLLKGTFVPPMKLKSKDEKALIKTKISISVKKTMSKPEVKGKIVKNRKNGYGPSWNKGLGLEDERIRKLRDNRLVTLSKFSEEERQEKWGKFKCVSKIETNFLNYVEECLRNIGWNIKILRQQRVFIDPSKRTRVVDGTIKLKSTIIFIEVDGCKWHNYPKGTTKDSYLDYYCEENKIQIFRVWDKDIIEDKSKCAKKIVSFIDDLLWYLDGMQVTTNYNQLRDFLEL
jgi:very-short-patch-repair endonuclease